MSVELLGRRAVARGARGAVACGSRTASAVGAAVLLDGGNAFDAAVAAALAETVALPSKCGLAGDLVALYRTPESDSPVSVIAVGGAATGLRPAAEALDWAVPATGALSVGVPGAPAGYARLAELGTMPLARLAGPAASLARKGVWWSPMNALLESEARALLRTYQPTGCVYSPATGPHAEGGLVPLPGLADALDEFVIHGRHLLSGDVGRSVVDAVAAHGGVLSHQDLASVTVLEEPAHRVDTACGPLWATNAPTFGAALTLALDRRRPGDITAEDVMTSVVDAGLARPRHAMAGEEGTSTVAAVDAGGNSIVIVHSLSFPQYGSGIVASGYDLVLSNRAGRGFVFDPDHPASPAPGKRPPTTLHAWGIQRDDGWLLGATPGGQQQVPWNVQVISRLFEHSAGAAAAAMSDALSSPRWEITDDGSTRLEGRDMPALQARSGHTLVHSGPAGCTAGADPRWDGTAVAS